MRDPHKRGFTLLEMLIVVAIIAVLATLLLGALGAARVRTQIATARSQIEAIKAALAMYESDHGRYPRLAARTGAPVWNDDSPALYAALMNRPTLQLGGGQNAPYLNDWKPEYVGVVNTTYCVPANMGNNWTQTDPVGVRPLANTGAPPETERLNDPNFQQGFVPADQNQSLVLLDPWGNPFHYREWASLRQQDKDTYNQTGVQRQVQFNPATFPQMAPGGDPPAKNAVQDRAHNIQQFDIWSNGPNGVNEFGDNDSDDVKSW